MSEIRSIVKQVLSQIGENREARMEGMLWAIGGPLRAFTYAELGKGDVDKFSILRKGADHAIESVALRKL